MRQFPSSFSDLLYMLAKIGLSPIRGGFVWLALARGSHIPFLGKNVKLIFKSKIKVGRGVWIGHNTYIDACCEHGIDLRNGVTIRENATIQCRSGLNPRGHGLIVGEATFIGPSAKVGVGGPLVIGANCQIGAHCCFNAESHVAHEGSFTSGVTQRVGINIGNNVWIGDGVIILDGVSVGDNAVLGAGAVVNKSVSAGERVAGVPAKAI